MNILYILCGADFYRNFTQEAYPAYYYLWPPMPAPCANYSNCNNDNERSSLDDVRSWERKISLEAKHMHKALKNRMFSYLPIQILNQWNQVSIGNPNATITDLIGWLIEEFGDTTEEEQNEIKRNLSSDWNVTLGINDLIMRITSAQMFFSMITSDLSEATLINAGNKSIRRTGLFVDEYKGWLKVANKTLQAWKDYWRAAVRNAKLANPQLAKHYGHGINLAQQDVADEEIFTQAVGNFAQGRANNSGALLNMTQNCASLTTENTNLLHQLNQLRQDQQMGQQQQH